MEDGTLAAALRKVASETGSEIVTLEPGVSSLRIKARVVSLDPRRALDEILRRTPYRAIALGGNSFRIERRPASEPKPNRAKSAAKPVAPLASEAIVVEAKFPTLLANYPGSASRVIVASGQGAPYPHDLVGVARTSPVLSTTAFGDGRDKIFIRGVADSSFNGASQPTTGIYFGNALVGFGSPTPNLRLHDIASVEILEGPQGTLYGSGSVGGVVRVLPNPVDLHQVKGSLAAALQPVSGGSVGRSSVGMVNMPLLEDRIGMRLVAYDERKAGFISDPEQGNDLNTVAVTGARAMFAAKLGGGFWLDMSAIYQSTSARDSQYADATGPLMRSSRIREPYSSDLALGVVSLKKIWDSGIEFNSTASFGRRTAFDRFDASLGRVEATALETERTSIMASSENRLSGVTSFGLTWVSGLALEYAEDGQSRAFGVPDSTNPLDEVTNLTRTASAFGQARLDILTQLEATAGLRFTLSRTDSRPARNGQASYIRGGIARRLDPTIALLWHASSDLAIYSRLQTGYRNGGVTVARGVGKVASFNPDSIALGELGFRFHGIAGLTLSGALSIANWKNVLGDIVSARGTPVATNLGDAKISAAEGSAEWHSGTGWSLGGGFMLTDNHLSGDLAMQSAPRNRLLPTSPKFSANGRANYASTRDSNGNSWSVGMTGQYVGRSVLGPGALLDISQGNYATVDVDAVITHGPLSVSLQIENLLNSHASRFGIGNPLALYRRDGYVPLQPRTATLTLSAGW